MPPPKLPTRGQQLATSGLGRQFTSPIKSRDPDKSRYVAPFGQTAKRRRLVERVQQLQAGISSGSTVPPATKPDPREPVLIPDDLPILEPPFEFESTLEPDIVDPPSPTGTFPRRTQPNQASLSLYHRWQSILPRLIDPYLEYISATMGRIPPLVTGVELKSTCGGACVPKTATILCLFQTRAYSIRLHIKLVNPCRSQTSKNMK